MFAEVSVNIFISNTFTVHKWDAPEAIVWAPPAFKHSLARSCDLFTSDVLKFDCVVLGFRYVPGRTQYVHAE